MKRLSAELLALIVVGGAAWAASPSSAESSSTSQVIPTCSSSDLHGQAGARRQSGGTTTDTFLLENVSGRPCRTQGYPTVALAAANGRRYPDKVEQRSYGEPTRPLIVLPQGYVHFTMDHPGYVEQQDAQCISWQKVVVTPPKTKHPIYITDPGHGCENFEVQPLQPGRA